MDAHTLRFMRSEVVQTTVADRQARQAWEAAGKPDSRIRAMARVEKLLAEHKAPGLAPEVDAAIRARYNILVPPAA
jgi:trimethylamine--corrinoid protein Co-methyltransferase